MSEPKSIQEFRRSLGKLSFLNTMIIHEKKEYIIYFQPMENKGKCKIQITNGFDFWVEDFDFDKFEQKRKNCGLEGTYMSYFDMMNRAILQRNFEVIVDHQQNFCLILYFQLNKGVSLKGDFDLGRPLHFDDIKEFHCVYRLFLFDIFKAKDQERMKVEQARKAPNRGGGGAAGGAGGQKVPQLQDEDQDQYDDDEQERKAPPPSRKKRNTGAGSGND